MKGLMSNAAANALQAAFSIVLTFVLYRIVIATLGIDQLGVWSVLLAAASISRLSDLGLGTGITRFVARDLSLEQPLRAAAVAETGLVTMSLAVGAVLVMLYASGPFLLGLVFDPPYLASAIDILPYALLSAWLSVVGMAAVSGLEGCQRFKFKAVILTFSQAAMVLLAIWLVPRLGLRGLAYAQVVQGLVLMALAWAGLRRDMPALPLLPWRGKWPVLREMLGYGLKVQASSLTMMLFDPLTKLLLARFGGPQAAGYFEVANQVIVKVRSVIVSANQVIVPQIAAVSAHDANSVRSVYAWSLRFTIFFALPAYALLLASVHLISALVFEATSPEFSLFFGLAIAGWAANTVAVPAYAVNLGTGAVDQNLRQHLLMGVLNLTLGLGLGLLFSAPGVALAYAASLALGSAYLVSAFQRRESVPLRDLALGENSVLLTVCMAVAVIGTVVDPSRLAAGRYVGSLIALAVAGLVMVVPVWTHPLRRELGAAWLSRRHADAGL
jgi:O-antigen/teichoic acid export membrane protein